MSSPFDRHAVDELDALDVGAFKIASFELVDLPFIRYAAGKGRPLILSTGMASLGEIEDAVVAAARGRRDRRLPAPVRVAVPVARARHEPALDPDDGGRVRRARSGCPTTRTAPTSPVAAVALGACIVEKHFTLDRTMPGPDHPFAAEPDELRSSSRTSATSRPRSATA